TIDLASRHLSAAYPDQIVLARLYALPVHLFVFFYLSGHRRDRRSFPTRRSSDLDVVDPAARAVEPAGGRGGIDDVPFVLLDQHRDRKSTRLNSSHVKISYAVFCLKKKN